MQRTKVCSELKTGWNNNTFKCLLKNLIIT